MNKSINRLGRKFKLWSFGDNHGCINAQTYIDQDGIFAAEFGGRIIKAKSFAELSNELRDAYRASRTYEWSARIVVRVTAGNNGGWMDSEEAETITVAARVIWLGEYRGAPEGKAKYPDSYLHARFDDGGGLIAIEDSVGFEGEDPLVWSRQFHPHSDEVLIPWSSQRWAALRDIQAKIRQLRERITEVLGNQDRIDALASGVAGLLGV
jgi:hypothetical protein